MLNDGCGRATSSTFLLFLGERDEIFLVFGKKEKLLFSHRKEKKGSTNKKEFFCRKVTSHSIIPLIYASKSHRSTSD